MKLNKELLSQADLQLILRKNMSEKLEVYECKTSVFSQFGENYSSTMVKIEAIIRKTEDSEQEVLHLVAKKGDNCEKYPLVWSEAFKKEVFVYSELIPMYKNLELEMGMNECDLFDGVPQFWGFQTVPDHDSQEIGPDSFFLMDNLKVHGYYTIDRRLGVDYEHAKQSLKALARYHALGIAIKQKRPKFLESVKCIAGINNLRLSHVDSIYYNLWKVMQDLPFLQNHLGVVEKSLNFCKDGRGYNDGGEEPWNTIIHGDFWINNILYHKNEVTDEIDNVKFCDFQLFKYGCPLRDLCYFLCSSIDEKTEVEHFDDLLDYYYENFRKIIEFMNCECKEFTKQSFDENLKKSAMKCFLAYALITNVCISNIEKNEADDDYLSIVFSEENLRKSAYVNKLQRITRIYERKEWFSNQSFD